MVSGMCFILCTSCADLTAYASAPLYGFDSNGDMAIVGTIDDDGNKEIFPEPVAPDALEDENGTLDAIQDMEPDSLEDLPDYTQEEIQAPVSDVYAADSPVVYAAEAQSTNSDFNPDSCLQYQASIGSYSGILMIPSTYRSSLFLDDAGVLWNVGSSTVTGRLFLSRNVSTGDWEQYIVNISSCLTNTANSVYQNGSLSRVTRYYYNGNRLTSSDYYGDVIVSKDVSTFAHDPDHLHNLYLLIIIFVLLGGGIICFSRRCRN